MTKLTISEARTNLYRLVDELSDHHEPVLITGKRHNAIMLSEEDWKAITETLHLLAVPGMRESIIEGMKTPLSDCSDKLDW